MVMLLANKMNKFLLWVFATIAMNIMNAISVTIGAIFPLLLPKALISIIVIALFFVFGLKMLYSGIFHGDDSDHENDINEAKETLDKLDEFEKKKEPLLPADQRQTSATQ